MTTQTNVANSATGYKGHRPGCMKEKAHRITDEMLAKKAERPSILARIVKLGATEGTASSWYQAFKAAAPKKAKGKPTISKKVVKKNGKK